MPLAIMWGKGIKNPGRAVYDYVSFIDIAPTVLEACGIAPEESGMQPVEGKSLMGIFKTRRAGLIDKSRDFVLIGKERHDVGRPDDAGYPVRGIVKEGYLYLVNYKPNRWPSGNPETGYLDCDASPVKSLILNMKRTNQSDYYWNLSFAKRPEEELYNVNSDPECLVNLAPDQGYYPLRQRLREQMLEALREQKDPRIIGDGDIFDKYPYSSEAVRDFHNRYMKGQISRSSAGWVDSTDFE
jgi:arylsulfatase A-like enzyme